MSCFYDVSQNAVLFLDRGMLTMDVFMTTGDSTEMKLVSQIFDFASSLAKMQLSEVSEGHLKYAICPHLNTCISSCFPLQICLALYSAYILLQDDRPGLQNTEEVTKLGTDMLQTLHKELKMKPMAVETKDEISELSKLIAKKHTLR